MSTSIERSADPSQEEMVPSEAFSRWAASFVGMEGNPANARYWFCGIEWSSENDFTYESCDQWSWPESEVEERLRKYPYNRRMAKLYAALKGASADQYKEVCLRPPQICTDSSDAFKLNLFPIGFRNDGNELWDRALVEKTGFVTKTEYRAWCQMHRFATIRKLVEQHRPRVIVGTSRTYLTEYALAFGGRKEAFDIAARLRASQEDCEGRILSWTWIDDGSTLLAVTPFLGGQSGLTSNKHLGAFGERIRVLAGL